MCIVETISGKVRGAFSNGVYTFKGIPYGATTGGDHRFLPPRAAVPWTGVRDALAYGPLAVQPVPDLGIYAEGDAEKFYEGAGPAWDRDGLSEDCLFLNVWTAGVDGGKRPVLLHCHGGGHWFGTGAAEVTDGSALARKKNIVVVDLNHRLNIFGYLYLGELAPERYADSGNCGLLDIVAALRWVQDNITAFGGDPDNVTIFGDSGGGSKVACILAMPAAQGLFHRAVICSAAMEHGLERADATKTAEKVLAHLGISDQRIDDIQRVPAKALLDAMSAVTNAADVTLTGWRDGRWFHMFAPVMDGRNLTQHPFHPDAPQISANVPLMIGTTTDETTMVFGDDPAMFSLNEADLRVKLQEVLHLDETRMDRLLAVYGRTMPRATPSDLFFRITSDVTFRVPTVEKAERIAALNKAPVYMYLFTWQSSSFGGKFKAGHGVELPFFYDNIEKATGMFKSTPDPRDATLAEGISTALANFVRAGNPSHAGLPEWKPYTATERFTMMIDYVCQVAQDPSAEERQSVSTVLVL